MERAEENNKEVYLVEEWERGEVTEKNTMVSKADVSNLWPTGHMQLQTANHKVLQVHKLLILFCDFCTLIILLI